MKFGNIVATLLKGKVLAVIGVGAALVAGGATTVMAATPTGHNIIQTVFGSHANQGNQDGLDATPTARAHRDDTSDGHGTFMANNHDKNCPGPTIQSLARMFSLSTDSNSDDIQALCALSNGTFTGTTPNGEAVTSSQVFSDYDIYLLLKYAQYLASHDQSNTTGKLTSDNARAYLAEALQSCGTTSWESCAKQLPPSFSLDNLKDSIKGKTTNGNNVPNWNWNSNNGDGHSSDDQNSGGKPAIIPTSVH
jgi:hypothetical protein